MITSDWSAPYCPLLSDRGFGLHSRGGAPGLRWCCLCLPVCCPAGFQQLAGGLLSSGQLLPYQESVVVDMLHKEVQRSMENQWQMARLETKRCVRSRPSVRSSASRQQKRVLLSERQMQVFVVACLHLRTVQQWSCALGLHTI